jgi:hypothetical protein
MVLNDEDDKLPTPEQVFLTISTSPQSATWVTQFLDLAAPAMPPGTLLAGGMGAHARVKELAANAVRLAALDVVERGALIDIAVDRAIAKAIDDPEPRERTAERRRRENAAALAQMAELHRQGKGRDAASIVARQMAVDPHDPHEVDMIAQRLRRLWRDSRG